MARKKSFTAAQTTAQTEEITSSTEQQAHDSQAAGRAPSSDAPAAPEQANGEPARRFVRHTFTSTAAGIRAGEDKRFNAPQVFIDFDDDKRATPEEKAEMGEAGLRYRPSDKGYSALATADTREARDELSRKFTERRLKQKAEQDEGPKR